MACEIDKKYWTNFDLFDAVKKICKQEGLPYNKSSYKLAEKLQLILLHLKKINYSLLILEESILR